MNERKAISDLPTKIGRRAWRSLLMPHRVTETLQRVHTIDHAARKIDTILVPISPRTDGIFSKGMWGSRHHVARNKRRSSRSTSKSMFAPVLLPR
jgi:hypothetical protein